MSEIKSFFRFSLLDARSLALLAIVVGVGAFLFNGLDSAYAKQWDIGWGYWAVLALGIALLTGLAVNAKEAWERLRHNLPTRRGLLLLALVVTLFSAYAALNVPLQHRVLSDENSWESMALQMRFHQSGGVCNQGVWEN